VFLNGTLRRYDVLTIDTGSGNVKLNGENANGLVNVPYSRFFGLTHGANDLRLALYSYSGTVTPANVSLSVAYRHAWH
jgi:hypothetical protein